MIKFDPVWFALGFAVEITILKNAINTLSQIRNMHQPPIIVSNLTFRFRYDESNATYVIQISRMHDHIKTVYLSSGDKSEIWWASKEHDRRTTLVFPLNGRNIPQLCFDQLMLDLLPWLA